MVVALAPTREERATRWRATPCFDADHPGLDSSEAIVILAPILKKMPRRERPSPLLDSVFRPQEQHNSDALRAGNASPVAEEIPVHNTFIQFGVPLDGALQGKQHLSTAPAWIGQPSLQSAMLAATEAARVHHADETWSLDFATSDGHVLEPGSPMHPHELSPKKLASPKKVPVMRYALSASSARAAGLPVGASGAVFANYGAEACVGRAGITRGTSSTGDDGGSVSGAVDAVVIDAVDAADKHGEEAVEGSTEAPATAAATPAVAAAVAEGELPSIGSAKHADGQCKRCCFFPKGRCLNGQNCEFCHFEHEKRKRKKKKKGSKRDAASDTGDESSGDGTNATPLAATTALAAPAIFSPMTPEGELAEPLGPTSLLGLSMPPSPASQEAANASATGQVSTDSSLAASAVGLSPSGALTTPSIPLLGSPHSSQPLQQQLQAPVAAQAQSQAHAHAQAHTAYFAGPPTDGYGMYGGMGYGQMYTAAYGTNGFSAAGAYHAASPPLGGGMVAVGPVGGALPPPR